MARIPQQILEEVLSRIDIVELVSASIPLKKAGRNFKACCPFHQEKTPSFVVSPDKQIYHCFGCGESGNAIRFLMRHERMEFLEALKALAQKAGVRLPEPSRDASGKEHLATKLYEVNDMAASFYAQFLQSPRAKAVREYLQKRSISEETIQSFRIGCAPDSWDTLILHARKKNISIALLEKAGLVLSKQGGGYYDRFRNRVIFPISDIRGRIIGFGARVLDNTQPKYINSPESYIYTKGKHLYGFSVAKGSIRDADMAIVVEGYLDCIVPYQAGAHNIVASLGTALTVDQVRLIKRYTRTIVLIYDADAAGQLAVLRSLDVFVDEEIDARIVSLPKGCDPDSFVRTQGQAALAARISEAENIFTYKLRILKAHHSSQSAEGKAKIALGMLETIARIKDEVLKSEYVRRLAYELDVREEAVRSQLQKLTQKSSGTSAVLMRQKTPASSGSLTEKLLVTMMLEEVDFIHSVRRQLKPGDFSDEKIARLVSFLFEAVGQGKRVEPNMLMASFQEEDVSQLICESLFLAEDSSYQHKERVVNDCIQRLKSERLKSMRAVICERIQSAQRAGDEAAVERLVEEFQCLTKQDG